MTPPLLTVLAPVKGALVPLDQVPDPVFSQKILGDGLAIDPADGLITAPFDGKIININPHLHALVIAQNNLELLVHVGLDTVRLQGEGFTPLVHVGDTVKAGQPLLRFDLARITESLTVPFVLCIVTAPAHVKIQPADCEIIQAGQPLFTVSMPAHKRTVQEEKTELQSGPILITNPQGLHARPAGVLARLCGTYPHAISICKNEQCVNAKSIVGIMGLALAHGDEVTLRLAGPRPQADAFLHTLQDAFAKGFGENNASALADFVQGVGVCTGNATGPAVLWQTSELAFDEVTQDPQADLLLLQTTVRAFITHTQKLLKTAPPLTQNILAAQLDFVQDPDLLHQAQTLILQGKSAAYGFYHAVENSLQVLQQTGNALLQERQADLQDLRRKIILKLNGQTAQRPSLSKGCIVVAKDLLPSDISYLQPYAAGVVLAEGSPTSHVGILLQNSALPTVLQAGPAILQCAPGTPLQVDATHGKVWINPPSTSFQTVPASNAPADLAEARTQDGVLITVSGTISTLEQAQAAAQSGADGLGLVRTEILLAAYTAPPSEEEQVALYTQIARPFTHPVVFRLVDAGADKPVPFLHFPVETNPMLGMRGIRAFQTNETFFRSQVRALLRVHATTGNIHILLPMVTFAEEVATWRKLMQEEAVQLHLKKLPPLGVMIETPAAALQSAALAQLADFFSVGTNDLTQYTLALDRTHPQLANHADPLEPAVLKLVATACQQAQQAKIPTAVCGAAASDIQAACILIGLGVRELAVPTPQLARMKQTVRQLSLKRCQRWAQQALECTNAAQVRKLLEQEGICG